MSSRALKLLCCYFAVVSLVKAEERELRRRRVSHIKIDHDAVETSGQQRTMAGNEDSAVNHFGDSPKDELFGDEEMRLLHELRLLEMCMSM